MFYIWATYAPFEKGQGLALAAKHYFGKEINMLTKKEIAIIVAVVKSPSIYKLGSNRLQKRIEFILE